MSSRRLRRQIKLAIAVVIACTYALLHNRVPVSVPVQYERWEQVARDTVRKTWAAKGIHEVLNSTLGFQEILVVNLPSRTDRRDAISLAGALTGLSFKFVDGVKGEDIDERVFPTDTQDKKILQGNKGSWRAHMNALRRVIESNMTSALIIEDDIDWDVRIKSQMQSFAEASRVFLQPIRGKEFSISGWSTPAATNHQSTSHGSSSGGGGPSSDRDVISVQGAPPYELPTTSPYGDNWDVLWLGHCGTDFPSSPPDLSSRPDVSRPGGKPAQLPLLRVTIPGDITVPEPKHLKPHPFASPDALGAHFPPHTRVVHAASGTICTQAYAVSQSGARKLLYQFGLESFTTGWDLMLRDWCDGIYMEAGDKATDKRPQCVTVQPPLFSHYFFNKDGSSDIQAQGGGYLHRTGSQYVRLSVRRNFRELVNGEPVAKLADQWPDVSHEQ